MVELKNSNLKGLGKALFEFIDNEDKVASFTTKFHKQSSGVYDIPVKNRMVPLQNETKPITKH